MSVPGYVQIGSVMRELPGGTINALVDGYYRQQAASRDRKTDRITLPPFISIAIKNASGADAEPGYVLGIDDLVFNPDENESVFYSTPTIEGVTPTTAAHADSFVILRTFIENDGIVANAGILSGVASVRLYVNSESDTYAKVKNNDATQLESTSSGPAKIIWKESATGPNKKAIVLLGFGSGAAAGDTIIVRVDAGDSITARSGTTRGSGTVQQVEPDLATETGSPFTAYNLARRSFTAPTADDLYLLATNVGGDYFIHNFEPRAHNGFDPAVDQSYVHDASSLETWVNDVECA